MCVYVCEREREGSFAANRCLIWAADMAQVITGAHDGRLLLHFALNVDVQRFDFT